MLEVESIHSKAERKKREKIPKRVTKINSSFFVIVIAGLIGIFGLKRIITNETMMLLFNIIMALVNAFRNPIIASFAFQVNRQIQRESVEDRRRREIEDALKKRAEGRRPDEENQENQVHVTINNSSVFGEEDFRLESLNR